MLDTIRRAQPAIIKTVLGAVVIAFVGTIFLEWGWQRPGRLDSHLARVGNEVVSVREYQVTYNNMMDFYKRAYQDRFTEEMARLLNLKQQALETLIQQKVLLEEAKRQGLTVTDAELITRVQNYPVFQVDGKFDRSRYVQVLRFSRLTPEDFEQSQREELLVAKLEHLVKDGIHVTENEVKSAFLRENEQVNVEYLRIDPARFTTQVDISEADLAHYYQEHQERFRKPERVRVAYVIIDPASFAEQVKITEEKLGQYYDEHKEEFYRDEQMRARHILLKLPPEANADEDARVRAEAEAIRQRIEAGEDFATVAQQVSQDPASAEQGGDLGFFKRGAMVKAFEEVAFTLQPGDVSAPVRTDFGYHLIKVEERQEAGYQSLEAVRVELTQRLSREEAHRLAEERAQSAYDLIINAGGSLAAAAEQFDLTVQETPLITRGQTIEGIEHTALFTQTAFELQEGQVSRPMTLGSRYAIMKPLERQASYIPPFEEVKDAVGDALMQERSKDLARQNAEAFITDLKAGKSLEELAHTLDSQAEQTGLFSRGGTIAKLGRPQGFIRTAFRMTVGEARVVNLLDQPAVIVLKERSSLDAEAYEREKEQVQQRLLQQKQAQIFAQWANEMRQLADDRNQISINQNVLAVL
jgi:peptidyl-prolyl cis-trans isomerase D